MEEKQEIQRKTVTEEIGEDYKTWKEGQKILITAPTGSGKTFFVLHTLLDYAWENNKKIVYFVNRIILKKQLEAELEHMDQSKYLMNANPQKRNISSFLEIWTYQSLEKHIKENTRNDEQYKWWFSQFDYLICDECHYFYCDSNYNTGTSLSYDFLTWMFMLKISIFMSATMENVKSYIFQNTNCNNGRRYFRTKPATESELCEKGEVITYTLKQDYPYLSIKLFGKKEDICELPDKYDGKWLIFVDSIEDGKNFCRELDKKYSDKKVVFIDAEYEKNEESFNTVESLAEQKFAPTDILIATSVLDNGVSIHDLGLRNIVIVTDNQETFIQMLGRKREDGINVNLFIPFQSQQFFQQRLNTVICPAENFIKVFYEKFYSLCQSYDQVGNMVSKMGCSGASVIKLFEYILKDSRAYSSARKLCCPIYPEVEINEFSKERILDLKKYYSMIIDKFKTEGESAFVRVQLEWLGISGEEADEIINDYTIGEEEKKRQSLIEIVEEVCDKELLEEDNKKFKQRISESVLFLLKSVHCESSQEKEELEKKISSLKKNDRTMSADSFNYCMSKIGLPYKMTKPNGKSFHITHVENCF